MRSSFLSVSLALSVVALAACGEAPVVPAQVDCSPVSPCGGNLDGTWKVRGVCALTSSCAGANYDFSGVSTTLTFVGSKVTLSGGGTASDTIPNACFGSADMSGPGCMALNSMAGYSCQPGADACRCTIDYTRVNQGIPQMSYLISGPQVIIGGTTYNYCVFNGVLRLSADLPNGAVAAVTEYVKQ